MTALDGTLIPVIFRSNGVSMPMRIKHLILIQPISSAVFSPGKMRTPSLPRRGPGPGQHRLLDPFLPGSCRWIASIVFDKDAVERLPIRRGRQE
jgi:hypothetical protein